MKSYVLLALLTCALWSNNVFAQDTNFCIFLCFGQSTMEALQSGGVYGFAGEIEGIVHAIWAELGAHAQVIATGGLAELIARHTDVISAVDPLLTLRGIEIVMRRQQRT
mgnify:CR=1 FL=1